MHMGYRNQRSRVALAGHGEEPLRWVRANVFSKRRHVAANALIFTEAIERRTGEPHGRAPDRTGLNYPENRAIPRCPVSRHGCSPARRSPSTGTSRVTGARIRRRQSTRSKVKSDGGRGVTAAVASIGWNAVVIGGSAEPPITTALVGPAGVGSARV